MLEKDIERRMCAMVRERGGLTYKFASPAASGVPDRIVITPRGEVWFVELKTTLGILTTLQKWQINQLEKRNANVRVIRGWDAAKAFIEEVMSDGI
jgi:streptogramin lyase